MDQLMREVEVVLKRHGDLPDEEIGEEAREVAAVFARRTEEIVSAARSADQQLLEALVTVARGADRAARIQIALSAGVVLYVLVWTIAVSVTHAL